MSLNHTVLPGFEHEEPLISRDPEHGLLVFQGASTFLKANLQILCGQIS